MLVNLVYEVLVISIGVCFMKYRVCDVGFAFKSFLSV